MISQNFKNVIADYLNKLSSVDLTFKPLFENDGRNIEQCCQYIIMKVKESGFSGFDDQEVFDFAVEYYSLETLPDIDTNISCKVVTNYHVELSEEEIAEAKQRAIDDIYLEARRDTVGKAKRQSSGIKTESQAAHSSLF